MLRLWLRYHPLGLRTVRLQIRRYAVFLFSGNTENIRQTQFGLQEKINYARWQQNDFINGCHNIALGKLKANTQWSGNTEITSHACLPPQAHRYHLKKPEPRSCVQTNSRREVQRTASLPRELPTIDSNLNAVRLLNPGNWGPDGISLYLGISDKLLVTNRAALCFLTSPEQARVCHTHMVSTANTPSS